MHRLSKITVRNFRSIQEATLLLADFTAMVGLNNAGKSNLIEAIEWVLRGNVLEGVDFHDVEKPIEMEAVIEGIDGVLLDALDEAHRKRIEPLCADGRLIIRRKQPKPECRKADIELLVRDPGVPDDGDLKAWTVNPAGIPQAIQALFPESIYLAAMQDAADDVGKFKTTSTIGRLISAIVEPVRKDYAADFEPALSNIKARLDADGADRPKHFTDFDKEASKLVQDFYPGVSLRLHVPTPDIDTLMKVGTIRVYEDGSVHGREVGALGHGAQRSIQMALIQLLAERQRAGKKEVGRVLLLVDEPELYQHPQAIEQVRLALMGLSQGSYQVVVATHSPIVIGREHVETAILVYKESDTGTAVRRSIASEVREAVADGPSQTQLLFSFSNACEVLFSNKVILVEGTTEQRVFPALFHSRTGGSLGAAKTGLVGLGGGGSLAHTTKILHALGLKTRAIVDLDYAFRHAVKALQIAANDPAILACKERLQALQVEHKFCLDDAGLPMKGNDHSAGQIFELLAADLAAKPHVAKLHEALRAHGIWMWTLGAIERHLGLNSKGEAEWFSFVAKLRSEGFEAAVPDSAVVQACVDWIAGP